jgi:hypothetical protein
MLAAWCWISYRTAKIEKWMEKIAHFSRFCSYIRSKPPFQSIAFFDVCSCGVYWSLGATCVGKVVSWLPAGTSKWFAYVLAQEFEAILPRYVVKKLGCLSPQMRHSD